MYDPPRGLSSTVIFAHLRSSSQLESAEYYDIIIKSHAALARRANTMSCLCDNRNSDMVVLWTCITEDADDADLEKDLEGGSHRSLQLRLHDHCAQ